MFRCVGRRPGANPANCTCCNGDPLDPVHDLNTKIRAFITGWNDRSHPFTWTETADQILNKANRQKTSDVAPAADIWARDVWGSTANTPLFERVLRPLELRRAA
jgi:hypothetical protein